MDIKKHIDFFNPAKLTTNKLEVHIIGVGAVGSNIALQLVKLGIPLIHLWDFDTVDEHNITNQVYSALDVNKPKVNALKDILLQHNPFAKIYAHNMRYTNQPLKGIIFLTVDSIKTRKTIAEDNFHNLFVKLVIDGRIGLERGQVYTTDWSLDHLKQNYINLCDFNDSETDAKVSACGTELSVSPSVQMTAAIAVAQLINFINEQELKQAINFDAFEFKITAL